MSAAGKKNRLKMKYPMKLWPFRPATRAGQNAIAIQITARTMSQMTGMMYPPDISHTTAASAPNIASMPVTDTLNAAKAWQWGGRDERPVMGRKLRRPWASHQPETGQSETLPTGH